MLPSTGIQGKVSTATATRPKGRVAAGAGLETVQGAKSALSAGRAQERGPEVKTEPMSATPDGLPLETEGRTLPVHTERKQKWNGKTGAIFPTPNEGSHRRFLVLSLIHSLIQHFGYLKYARLRTIPG